MNPTIPICPLCNRPARRAKTKYGLRDSCDECGLHSWDGKPLTFPETHKARTAAHKAFDPIWQTMGISRSRAYHLLSQELNIPPEETHMSLMDKETAERVPAAADKIKDHLAKRSKEEETRDRKERRKEIGTKAGRRKKETPKQTKRSINNESPIPEGPNQQRPRKRKRRRKKKTNPD